mgnify:CR=1 FL=1
MLLSFAGRKRPIARAAGNIQPQRFAGIGRFLYKCAQPAAVLDETGERVETLVLPSNISEDFLYASRRNLSRGLLTRGGVDGVVCFLFGRLRGVAPALSRP